MKKGNVKTKEGDDYPARIYITFEYDPKNSIFLKETKYNTYRILYGQYPPLRAINYVWESTAPKGTAVPNPYASRVLMIVVESGPEKIMNGLAKKGIFLKITERLLAKIHP